MKLLAYKRNILILFIGIVFCLLLTSCGNASPPKESRIKKDLPSDLTTITVENPFDRTNADVYDMEVAHLTIDKRQTNGKEDTAYCIVELKNEFYAITRYLKLNYNYYDKGGWILDGYSEYQGPYWKTLECPFDVQEVASALNDFTIVQYGEKPEFSMYGGFPYTFSVEDEYENLTSKGEVVVNLHFEETHWEYDIDTRDVTLDWDIVGHWHSYIYSGIYLDILELTDESALVEIIYESTAEDALAGEKGPLIDVSDEEYWHIKTETIGLWEEQTEKGDPYLHFRFEVSSWSDTWDIYIFEDSALATVRNYPNTELYRVDENPFLSNS